ncbi:uncharacterized protein BX663DRAFT_427879 [Cokeromyces recurvatus]|uniref:uncharacterized protein n=1 Tax=Cokeromyces recurvatus TaxID=90255 RepID=UPI00221F9968|nr:uncharacterized protein BX663DRAFT_427879 [Cokeromyces recurvatus]KAI7906427.1 hypothetical protein BX663DRAFT_427879 [Cokeromyces recurvatus]
MSTSFANLFRNSRLATYDRTISQVYTTPLKNKQTGDWGLKRNLPAVIRTRYVTIDALDTAEHQTPWKSGNDQVLFIKRWKENFPDSKKPVPRLDREQFNITNMTPANFKCFLQQCAKHAPEFQQLLKKKELVPEQVYDYLNITFKENPAESPIGPTFSEYTSKTSYSVQGRILNSEKGGYAVGVGGVVAFLPKRHSWMLSQKGDRRVRTFYVESACIDEDSKPRVTLTTEPPIDDASHSFSSLFDQKGNHSHPLSTKEMFLTKGKVKRRIDDDDQVKPNPDHDKLMDRMFNLMEDK